MKQTAVEWLIAELRKPYAEKFMSGILTEAIAMEKNQIIEAHMAATLEYVNPTLDVMKFSISSRSEEYYTETYKQK